MSVSTKPESDQKKDGESEGRSVETKVDGNQENELVLVLPVGAGDCGRVGRMEIGSIGEVVFDLMEEAVVAHEVLGVIGAVVLDEVVVREGLAPAEGVAYHISALLAVDVRRHVLVWRPQHERESVEAVAIGRGEAEHVLVGVVVGVAEGAPHVERLQVCAVDENCEEHGLLILADGAPIEGMVVESGVVYAAVVVFLHDEIVLVLCVGESVHVVYLPEGLALLIHVGFA